MKEQHLRPRVTSLPWKQCQPLALKQEQARQADEFQLVVALDTEAEDTIMAERAAAKLSLVCLAVIMEGMKKWTKQQTPTTRGEQRREKT